MFDYAFHTDIFIVSLTVKLVRLVMEGTELMILADLFFLTGQLQHNEVFSQHVGFYLWVMLETTRRTVQKLLLVVDYRQALLANRVATV